MSLRTILRNKRVEDCRNDETFYRSETKCHNWFWCANRSVAVACTKPFRGHAYEGDHCATDFSIDGGYKWDNQDVFGYFDNLVYSYRRGKIDKD